MKSLSLSQPHIIVMTGIPGSGKSHFAQKFADTFNAPFVSYAHIRTLANDDDTLAGTFMSYHLRQLLKTKQSIVFDGPAATRTERTELANTVKKAGYELLIVWTQTDLATAKTRSTKNMKDKTSPTIDIDEFERRLKQFTAPDPVEQPVVISGKHTYASQAKVVLKKLSAPRAADASRATPAAPSRPPQTHRRSTIKVR